MTILLSDSMNHYIKYACKILNYIIENFEIMYDKHLLSSNVHGLVQ